MTTDNTTIQQSDGQLMSPEGYIATAVVLFCIGFIGFFSNLSVIVLMCKNKQVSKINL
jgi:NADH:ubiquinone oxidoreductase subunit K